jgi:hypothetical protein
MDLVGYGEIPSGPPMFRMTKEHVYLCCQSLGGVVICCALFLLWSFGSANTASQEYFLTLLTGLR